MVSFWLTILVEGNDVVVVVLQGLATKGNDICGDDIN
jgi:hypothetical protein